MISSKILQTSFLLFSLGNTLYATNHTLTLNDAIDIALKNNAKMKVSQTAVAIAQTMYNQAMSAEYPSVDASVNAMRMDQAPSYELRGVTTIDNTQTIAMYNQLSGAASADGANTLSATYDGIAAATPQTSNLPVSMSVQTSGRDIAISKIAMQYPLYTGGKISSIIKQAKIGKLIAQEGEKRSANEVAYDVKRYYYGALLAKDLQQLANDTLERMRFVRDLTQKLYNGGSLHVKKTDYLRSQLSVQLIESLTQEITQKEEMAKAALIFAMGLPWQDTITLREKDFKEPQMNKALDTLVSNAYKFNPDYTTLKMAIKVNDAKIDESKSEYLPTIGLMASAQNLYSDYNYGMTNEQNKNTWTIGAGVNWSLFNGMRTTNEVEQHRLEKLKLQQQQIILRDALALQVKQAFLQMKNSYNQYKILFKASQTAAENRDLNTRAYQEEMVETKDVIEAQLMESYTKGAYYRALHNNALAHAQADYIVAKSVEEEIKK